jgi:hypothetical protein
MAAPVPAAAPVINMLPFFLNNPNTQTIPNYKQGTDFSLWLQNFEIMVGLQAGLTDDQKKLWLLSYCEDSVKDHLINWVREKALIHEANDYIALTNYAKGHFKRSNAQLNATIATISNAIQVYHESVQGYHDRVYKEYKSIQGDLTEQMKITYFIRGLLPGIQKALIATTYDTLNDALAAAKNYELFINSEGQHDRLNIQSTPSITNPNSTVDPALAWRIQQFGSEVDKAKYNGLNSNTSDSKIATLTETIMKLADKFDNMENESKKRKGNNTSNEYSNNDNKDDKRDRQNNTGFKRRNNTPNNNYNNPLDFSAYLANRKDENINSSYPPNTCFNFAKTGKCRFGKDCRYEHILILPSTTPTATTTSIPTTPSTTFVPRSKQ